MEEKVFSVIGVSPGIALGRARILNSGVHHLAPEMRTVEPEAVEGEIARFHEALDKTRDDLLELRRELNHKLNAGDAGIFDAHLLIVEDRLLNHEVTDTIRRRLLSAEAAFYTVVERYVSALSAMADSYIKERAADIRDVGSRVMSYLLQSGRTDMSTQLTEECVVLARDLTPSDTAKLDRAKVLAFATETGSKTSHSAILARSMQIPALVGLGNEIFDMVKEGDLVIVDGGAGRLIINPGPETEALYKTKFEEEKKLFENLGKASRLRPETLDGFAVQLSANLEKPQDLPNVSKFGACGIGLFRTEFLFMNSAVLPTEEEQYAIYRKLLTEMKNEPVVIRTLDIGGDKFADAIGTIPEANPALGLRGIRLGLKERQDLLRTQLRALLRAAPEGNLKVMLPMITDAGEVREVKALVLELAQELRREKLPCGDTVELGAMIETPAAALTAEALAREVDFFSIGTNDLVQYTLCFDRGNERVAYMYRPAHPAVLRLIRNCVLVARERNLWVGVCGELAGDPRFTPLLLGLGVHELSMTPASIGPVRHVIRKMRMREAEELAAVAVAATGAEEVMQMTEDLLKRIAPEILALVTGDL